VAPFDQIGGHSSQHATLRDGCCLPYSGLRPALQRVLLHSVIGYVTPADKMCGRDEEILADRDHNLEQVRSRRKVLRAEQC
jgi:hypothetical protein